MKCKRHTAEEIIKKRSYHEAVQHFSEMNKLPTRTKKANKSVVVTAGNVPRSLRSGRPKTTVPHFKR